MRHRFFFEVIEKYYSLHLQNCGKNLYFYFKRLQKNFNLLW